MMTFPLSGLAAERYALPAWIAPGRDGQVLVRTGESSGKVKRIRNNPRGELVACDTRGRIRGAAAPLEARAHIATDGDTREMTETAMKAKCGLQYAVIGLANKLTTKRSGSVVLRIAARTADTTVRE